MTTACVQNDITLRNSLLKEIKDILTSIQDYLFVIMIIVAVLLAVPVMYAIFVRKKKGCDDEDEE